MPKYAQFVGRWSVTCVSIGLFILEKSHFNVTGAAIDVPEVLVLKGT